VIHQFENILNRSATDLEQFLKSLRTRFNRSSYSLFSCNCNHFSVKILHFFGIDTEFIQSLPTYGKEVLNRSVKVASGLGVGGVIGGIGSMIAADVGMATLTGLVTTGPIGAAVATIGTVVVGTGAAGLTGKVVNSIYNTRRKSSSIESHQEERPPSPSEFDPF